MCGRWLLIYTTVTTHRWYEFEKFVHISDRVRLSSDLSYMFWKYACCHKVLCHKSCLCSFIYRIHIYIFLSNVSFYLTWAMLRVSFCDPLNLRFPSFVVVCRVSTNSTIYFSETTGQIWMKLGRNSP